MVAELAEQAAAARHRAGLAELRDVPGGVRARLRGSAPGRSRGCGYRLLLVRVAVLAARVALPGQRQVPARLDAAVHVLRRRARDLVRHRAGRGARRGLPAAPDRAELRPPRHADAPRRRRAASTRIEQIEQAADAARGAGRAAAVGAGAGPAREARPAPRGRASTRTRSASPRTATPRGGPRALRRPRRRTPAPASASSSPAGSCALRDHGGLSSPPLRDGTGDLQVMLAADVLGDASACAAGSSRRPRRPRRRHRRGRRPPDAASCRCWPRRWQMAAKCLRPLPDKQPRPRRPGGAGPAAATST